MPKNVFAYRYGHLPKVKKKIEGVLKKLKLQPVYKKHTVDKFLRQEKRFYMPPVVHQTSDKKYFFKARLQNTDEVLHTGLKEIRFHKRIKKTAERFRSTVIIPEYEKAGVEKNGFIWFLREYLEGKFAGQMDIDFGYKTFFLKKISPRLMAKAVIRLQKSTSVIKNKVNIGYHGWGWYEADFNYYRNKKSLQHILAKEILSAEEVLKNQHFLLEKSSKILSHGDLYPNNLLITSENKLALFDWELVHLNNQAFDPCFIWMLAWRSPSWQKKFFKTICRQQKNKKQFRILWRLVMLSLCFRFIRHCRLATTAGYHQQMSINGYDKKEIKNVLPNSRSALKHHLKNLKIALKSPNKVFKP